MTESAERRARVVEIARPGGSIAFLVVLAVCGALYWNASPVLLDDSFTYLRVAQNWLAGYGPRFNPGDAHMPITSPGWLLLLMAGKMLVPAASFVTIAKVTAFARLLGASLVLARRHPQLPLAANLAPIPVFFTPWMAALAAMTPLALLAGLAMIQAVAMRRAPPLVRLPTISRLGCMSLARPICIVFCKAARVAHGLLVLPRRRSRLSARVAPLWYSPDVMICRRREGTG
jgi:hypothetical protein